jgi:hypothetical protein
MFAWFRDVLRYLRLILFELIEIHRTIKGHDRIFLSIRTDKGETFMPVTLEVGKTATAVAHRFKGTVEIPLLGAPVYSSSDPSIATVDASSGLITAIAEGTATISGADTDGLSGSDSVTGQITQTIQLVITANP